MLTRPPGRPVSQPGCTWGEVDHACHVFGLAVPAGIISTTGVSGLTLGGGHGYLTRKYGLTIDNLLEVDLVLADGRFVTANASQNPDLFWAVRGGGGNFGVVTSFVFRTQPVKTVFGGPVLWKMNKAAQVMRWYRDFMPKAPEDLYGFFAFLKVLPAHHFRSHCIPRPCVALFGRMLDRLKKQKRFTNPFASLLRQTLLFSVPCPSPPCKAFLMDCYRPDCSGTGKAISSTT